jgi:hypothetical protein
MQHWFLQVTDWLITNKGSSLKTWNWDTQGFFSWKPWNWDTHFGYQNNVLGVLSIGLRRWSQSPARTKIEWEEMLCTIQCYLFRQQHFPSLYDTVITIVKTVEMAFNTSFFKIKAWNQTNYLNEKQPHENNSTSWMDFSPVFTCHISSVILTGILF